MANPRVTNAVNAPFPTTVEVYFDSDMLNDDELIDPDNYLFDHGAYTTYVFVKSDRKVMLIVQNLFEQDDFVVTVSNVSNKSAEVIDSNFNSWSLAIVRENIPGFASAISATNGRLKSGTNAIQIKENDDYWYIMTESGVDIVSRASLINSGFILSEESFNTIHIG